MYKQKFEFGKSISVQNLNLNQIYKIIFIFVFFFFSKTLNECYQNCSNENSAKLPSVEQVITEGKIRLLCRSQDVMNIKIEPDIEENTDLLYLIAFHENSTGILPKTYLIVSFGQIFLKIFFRFNLNT